MMQRIVRLLFVIPICISFSTNGVYNPQPDFDVYQIWDVSSPVPYECMPLELMVPYRFDIMAKYIYAKHWHMGIASVWAQELYTNHLKAWNNFYEQSPLKNGIQDYLNAFHAILNTTKQEGYVFPDIPVNNRKIPLDGAHRIAAALLYNKKVSCIAKSGFTVCATASFFKNSYYGTLDEKYLDAMAMEYCQLKNNIYIALLFPVSCGKEQQVQAIMRKYAHLVYDKQIVLKGYGPLNFIKHIYKGEPWLGDYGNNFAGARFAMQERFPAHEGVVRVYLLESLSGLDAIKRCKAELRALFSLDNKAVHITDTPAQAVSLARMVFNKNSIFFLNYADQKKFDKFSTFLKDFKQWIAQSDIEPETVCVDGSAVLSAFGLRDCNDLDFLHFYPIKTAMRGAIASHNPYVHYYKTTVADIIFNPNNYFYYDDVKFVSLDLLERMKTHRKEKKDYTDIQLIYQCRMAV